MERRDSRTHDDLPGAVGSTPAWTTRILLDAWRRGCLQSADRLFSVHRDALLAEARVSRRMRFLRAGASEEDLVDEVFVRALASGMLGSFEPRAPGALRHALGRVLQFVLADACRRAGAARRRPPDAGPGAAARCHPELQPAIAGSPSGVAQLNELLELCRSALDPHEWDAWWLVEVEGLTSKEAGERLGRTASSVRGVVLRARARLVPTVARAFDRPPPPEEARVAADT